MDVILLENMGRLGKIGDLVSVRPGYGRNYLLPTGKALRANAESKAVFEKKRAEIEKKNSEIEAKARDLIKKIDKKDLSLLRQAGETGRLYGSVSARDIAAYLNEKFGASLEAHSIRLVSPLKEVGIFPVSVVPYGDLTARLRIVIAQTEEEVALLLKAEKEEAEKAAKQAKLEKEAKVQAEKEVDAKPSSDEVVLEENLEKPAN